MGLGTLTLQFNASPAPGGPFTRGPLVIEQWKFANADNTRGATDIVTAKFLTKILFARGSNQDTSGATDPFTIDNTVFPPTCKLNFVATGDAGEVDLYGY